MRQRPQPLHFALQVGHPSSLLVCALRLRGHVCGCALSCRQLSGHPVALGLGVLYAPAQQLVLRLGVVPLPWGSQHVDEGCVGVRWPPTCQA